MRPSVAGAFFVASAFLVPAPVLATVTPAARCEQAVAKAITSCVSTVGGRTRSCYRKLAQQCALDFGRDTAISRMMDRIRARCTDTTLRDAGFGPAATVAGLLGAGTETCRGEADSIAARTFGGPQAAVLRAADKPTRSCLDRAMREALSLEVRSAKARAACIKLAHTGRACDVAATTAQIGALESAAMAKIAARCPALKTTIGLDPAGYVVRAAAQARCVTATEHGDSGPLTLDCGRRASVPVPPRDTWTQVTLDEATYGTRCGDGSPYAFWVRLAPTGSSSNQVVVDLQGGGVCVFESDCVAVPASLFSALDDGHPTDGLFSTNPAVNPFADWTMVFVPYCTQDVHIGGGVTDVFPSITVQRFGAINARAALRYVRDVLWGDLAATDPDGTYNAGNLKVLFGGESAGAFGVNYNYHYLLDDLRWKRTTAVPDAGLGLDNGQVLGVQGLGIVVQGETGPLGWGVKPFLPSYCQDTTCAIGPVLQATTAARLTPSLRGALEQQYLNVSNQVDLGQVTTTFFPDTPAWINALRTAYCTNKGLSGIRNWFPAVSAEYHTILTTASRWSTVTAGGQTLPDFLAAAMQNPDAVTDHVDEGTLVADYPGVDPLACSGSPSGAFVD